MKRARLFFKVGAWALAVTGILHLLGHVSGPSAPTNDTERTLLDLATNYRYAVGGFERSLMDFMNGFSLVFTLFCWFAAVAAFLIARSKDDALLRASAILFCGTSAVTLVLSWVYFVIPPIVCFGVIFLCELAAVVASRGD